MKQQKINNYDREIKPIVKIFFNLMDLKKENKVDRQLYDYILGIRSKKKESLTINELNNFFKNEFIKTDLILHAEMICNLRYKLYELINKVITVYYSF